MNDLAQVVRILRAGGLVAFPTETVYGLGADATNPAAVRRIYAAKGRPPTNPLIAHVADRASARRYAAHWPPTAERLAERFWPGPLTLVLPKHPSIALEATAGRETIGLRAPDHPVALELLRAFRGPVCAPSANRSNHVSPTTAEHVREELGDAVDLILDGGPCQVGIESTVLDLSSARPMLLRPGAISREQIEAEIGPVDLFHGSISPTTASASPGQQAIHYAPRTPAYRFESTQGDAAQRWIDSRPPGSVAILTFRNPRAAVASTAHRIVIELPSESTQYARRLYAALREADHSGAAVILIALPPDRPEWAAVRDRLFRAAQPLPGA